MKKYEKIFSAAVLCLLLSGCSRTDLSAPDVISNVSAAVETGEAKASAEAVDTGEAAGNNASSQEAAAFEEAAQTAEQGPHPAGEDEENGKLTARAREILAGMTVEEKAGQVVIGRYPGANAPEEALKYRLCGYVMFAADFENFTPEDIRENISAIQNGAKVRMLFAADEEGGNVVRISKFPQYREESFPSQREVFSAGGAEGVFEDAAEKSRLLGSLGLNMNLAPVCDLPRSESDYIADRAFGTDAGDAESAAASAVAGYQSEGMICTLKHFPGYGNNVDTHTGISIDKRPLSELEELDLRPFLAGMSEGAPVVMVSHNIVECVDDSLPGSLSPKMYAYLRETGFDGVAMTDDLSMQAVGEYCGEEQAAVTAFNAGADLLCCTDYASAVSALTEAANSGGISGEKLNGSAEKILVMKLKYGIIS